MINMEPKKSGLTPDDVLFVAVFVSLMMIAGAVTWLEWMKTSLNHTNPISLSFTLALTSPELLSTMITGQHLKRHRLSA